MDKPSASEKTSHCPAPLRHALSGWCASSPLSNGIGAANATASATIESCLPVTAVTGANFAVSGTGSCHEVAPSGAVAVAGHPRFRDRELSAVAASAGAAAAIALGYRKYSGDVFAHIFGPYACAIVDPGTERVLLGIDRLGQHSLYYSSEGVVFSFGSSIAAIPGQDDTAPTLLKQGVYNYLYFHMVPCSESVYAHIRKIPAAHYVEYRNGTTRVVNYWTPQFATASAGNKNIQSMSAQLKKALRESVKNCLPADGTVGCFLSGGLDSSTVTGFLAEATQQQAAAYSIGFAAEGYDEMAFARITARHFGVKLNEYYVTPEDVVTALPMIASSYDEPFGNSSALPAYFCARLAAADGVTTLLAGDGGDEIFAGNERYLRQNVFERYAHLPGPVRRGLIEPLARLLPQSLTLVAKASSYIAQANTPLPDRLQSYNFLHRHSAADIFTADFLADVNIDEPIELLRSIYRRPTTATDLDRMLYLDWQITLADNDLRKVSHTCAMAGVDVVYPMLDDALVEFSCQIPSRWKMQGGVLRHFYKEALKGWLPDATINKSKQGFGLPFGVWMQTYKPLQELAYDNMLKLKQRGFVRADFIDKAIEMHQSEHAAYYGELVWILTVFELWMQAHSQAEPGVR